MSPTDGPTEDGDPDGDGDPDEGAGAPRRSIGRGSSVVAAGQVGSKALVLVRNIAVANALARSDFGIAATYLITIQALDLATQIGVEQFLVQRPEGDEEDTVAAAHAWNALRGVALAVLLLLAAPLVAGLFGVPDRVGDFRLLALVPLLKGIGHLDPIRYTRGLRFGPSVATELAGEAVSAAVAIGIAFAVRDPRAVLFALVAREATISLTQYLAAERPYRLLFDRERLLELTRFGWPLTVNGIVLFGIVTGDRLLVGAFYDLEALAGYSVAFGLTLMPTLMLARINARVVLPVLSRAEDRPTFLRSYGSSTALLQTIGALLAVGYLSVGPPFVVLLYGEQYDDVGVLLAILGATQAIKLIRGAPTQAALSQGETANAMQANMARLAGVVAAVPVAMAGLRLELLATVGLVAELVAFLTAVWLLRLRHGVPGRSVLLGGVRAALPALATMVVVLLFDLGVLERVLLATVACTCVLLVVPSRADRERVVGWFRAARAAR